MQQVAGRSFKGFLVNPDLLCRAFLALLAVWVCYCSLTALVRSGFGGKAACAGGLCQGAGAGTGVAVAQFAAKAGPVPALSPGVFEHEAPLLAVFVQVESR